MKFFAAASLALLSFAVANPTPNAAGDEAAAAEQGLAARDLDLGKRDCSYRTICTCDGQPADIFCGRGSSPRGGWCLEGYVYQCDGEGNTCRYGPRDDCN
ncbi:hypothetical protein CC85DRAFT_329335 [Cutaneotrichosporon oleaginosum]|uniref:Uncharacterized protein n=1 Tax=Cutaneotrichosporon oleaginosum TaxID=879819 RepID=A0A0J0XJ59_9TREE|nr:uncharacterized protein CC85DRAFT_329335 [Cutaneotrichosporon oleaginosum]KLT41103.1 hypothetical protein CC85DRAFT_329335 [Cutaneotrichosporon oleaginosum]